MSNPPPPNAAAAAAASTALTALTHSAATAEAAALTGVLALPKAAPQAGPYASAPWSPSTRGWLVATDTQRAVGARWQAGSASAAEKALAVNRAANALIIHPSRDGTGTFQAAPARPQRVLEEEEYLEGMERIIRRDFFPALDSMQRKLGVHTPAWDGRMTGSATAARGRGALAGDTPAATPLARLGGAEPRGRREGEAPDGSFEEGGLLRAEQAGSFSHRGALSSAADASAGSASAAASSSQAVVPRAAAAAAAAVAEAEAASKVLLHPHDLRLGSYVELHTSEDNAAFAELQAKRQRLLDQKRPWTTKEAEAKINDQRLVLYDDPNRAGNPSGWKYKVRNPLFFYPEHEGKSELAAEAYTKDETSSAQVARALARSSASIEYENTRFPGLLTNPFPGQNASSAQKTAVPNTPAAASANGAGPGATPAVGGYKLLRDPSPAPGVDGDVPQITWGSLLATPAHLAGEDGDAAEQPLEGLLASEAARGDRGRFQIAPTPSRDAVAWGLAERARKDSLAAKKRRREDATPVPLSPALATPLLGAAPASPAVGKPHGLPKGPGGTGAAPRTPLLSPAAQRLMASTLRAAKGPASASAAARGPDWQLRASYSPSPAALAHGGQQRTARNPNPRQTPAVPVFNAATPGPMQLPPTPAR